MKKAVDYWRSGKTKKITVEAVCRKFNIAHPRQLYRYGGYADEDGNKFQKWREVWNYTLEKFLEAVQLKLIVHDCNLRFWAMEKARELKIPNFSISKGWLHKFKIRNRIVSRKINKLISLKEFNKSDDLKQLAEQFNARVNLEARLYEKSEIFNTDQSGFNLEMHSGRTLAPKGVKNVEACVQNLNATTHSYTIQPVISADGVLQTPMLVVLKEPTGNFGSQVFKKLKQRSNISVDCSKSGKLGKEHLKTWFEKVYFPNSPEKSLLLVDSWNVYKNRELINSVKPENKSLSILTIPPKTTGFCQPLDKYFFRQYKVYCRKISDMVLLGSYNVDLHNRNEIIKMHSLVHNQFSSPRFEKLIHN